MLCRSHCARNVVLRYLCGGQSNMQFAMPVIANATEEIARADKYPLIRLFTVGQKTSSRTPLLNLETIEEAWSVASAKTVSGNGGFGYFSAVSPPPLRVDCVCA